MKAAEGMNKLGWHWWPGPNAIPSRPYAGRNQCVRRGTCLTGCPERAKASTDHTHWPIALENGADADHRRARARIAVNKGRSGDRRRLYRPQRA